MSASKRKHSEAFKAKVAVEAIKGQKTVNEISSKYSVHSPQIARWKQPALQGLQTIFEKKLYKENRENQEMEKLYEQIGRLQVELAWLKKKHECIY